MTNIQELTDRQLMDEVLQIAEQAQWHRDKNLLLELVRRFESRSPQGSAEAGRE